MSASESQDGSSSGACDRDTSKDAQRQERIKEKNRRAQRKYREKKLLEVDNYKQQIRELNARMRAMAEEKRALEKDKNRLERMVQAEPVQAAHSQPPAQQRGQDQSLAKTARTVTDVFNAHPFLNESPEEQVINYKRTVCALQKLLAAGADHPSSPLHPELLKMMQKVREVQHMLVVMFPYRAARLKADIEEQACNEVGPHTPALFQSVVAAGAFTPQQRQKLIALRAELLRNVDAVVAERRRLMSEVKAMLPHPDNASSSTSTPFNAQLSTSKLRQNLEREYQLITNFIVNAIHETMTPQQQARCIVAAAPHLPDILYICSLLYVEEQGLPPGQVTLLPDMNSICSDMSSYGWITGREQGPLSSSLWPAVYQGLEVYQEPAGLPSPGAPFTSAPMSVPDAAHAGAGGDLFADEGLPCDALAALLAADSWPTPDELDPWLTVEPAQPPATLTRLPDGSHG